MERRQLKALVVIQPFSSITGWAYHDETGSYLMCSSCVITSMPGIIINIYLTRS